MPRVEGFHETYTYGYDLELRGGGLETRRTYAEIDVKRWRVRFGLKEFQYELANFDIMTGETGDFVPAWRVLYDDLGAIQMCNVASYDKSIILPSALAEPKACKYFDIPIVEQTVSGTDSWGNRKTHNTGVYKGTNIQYGTDGHKAGETHVVLFAFLKDGSRKLMSLRSVARNVFDGTRGYEALLKQQAAITNGIVDARTRGGRNRLKDYEQGQYL